MRRIAIVVSVILVVVSGCAVFPISRPSPIADPIKLRQSIQDLDASFEVQNNETGEWTRLLVHQAVIDNGERLVYEYRWVKTGLTIPDPSIFRYRVVVENGYVVSYDVLPPEHKAETSTKERASSASKPGMDILCKDAIARQDRGGIFVHCE